MNPIHTIGHSNYALSALLYLLQQHDTVHVVDVRSTPFSRYFPHFDKRSLEKSLPSNNIEYVFMGDTLGGRPSDPGLYDDQGRVDYGLVRSTAPFQRSLNQLLTISDQGTTVLLCSERDPLKCHRTLMLAAALAEQQHDARHIMSQSRTCVSHRDLMDKLVATQPQMRLVTPEGDPHEQAIRLQAARYAYVKKP